VDDTTGAGKCVLDDIIEVWE